MLTMTKPKGRPKGPDADEKKAVLHVEIPAQLKADIEALAESNQRKITGEVILALREHLAKHAEQKEGKAK